MAPKASFEGINDAGISEFYLASCRIWEVVPCSPACTVGRLVGVHIRRGVILGNVPQDLPMLRNMR